MGYQTADGVVRWHDFALRAADPASFEALSTHFARDRHAVWVCQKRFTDSAPASLRLLADSADRTTAWAMDARNVYRTNLPRIEKKLRAASVKVCDEHFAIDGPRVWSFDAEGFVKDADGASFRALGGGYGVDAKAVFHWEARVTGADPKTFRSIGGAFGADTAGAYWASRPLAGVDPSSARVLGNEYLTDGRKVFRDHQLIAGAHAPSFEALGRWFARDAQRVYCQGRPVPDADAATFKVVNGELPAGRDATARYVWSGTAGLVRAASELAPTKVGDLTAVLHAWWAALETHAFPIFDSTFNTSVEWKLDDRWKRRRVEPTATVLEHRDGRLTVSRGAVKAEGSISGFMHPLAAAWAADRGLVDAGVPCIRLLDERVGFMGPEGDLIRCRLLEVCFDESMKVIDLLSGATTGLTEELTLLFDLVERRAQYTPELARATVERRSRHDLGSEPRVHVAATTNLAAARRLLEGKLLRSRSVRDRVAAAEFLHARFADLDERKGRHLPGLFEGWAHLLNDSNARVCEIAWETLDLMVHVLFEMDAPAYEACLGPLARLIERGVNLDLNLARQWECATAVRDDALASAAWQRLERLVGTRGRAPQYFGASPTKTFADWRRAGTERVAARVPPMPQSADQSAGRLTRTRRR